MESSLESLERDLEALELKLETEQDLLERARIKGEIDQIEETIEMLKGVSKPATAFLMHGLQNNINAIELELDKEMDVKKREELKIRKEKCIEALAQRNAPINSPSELEDALFQIEHDDKLLTKLGSGNLDQVDVEFLRSSDLLPFLDEEFQAELEIAYQQMFFNDRAQNAFGRKSQEALVESVDDAWFEYHSEVEAGIDEINFKIDEIDGELGKQMGLKAKERLRREKHRLEAQLKHQKKQLQKRESWQHRHRTLTEIDASKPVMGSLNPKVLDKIKSLFQEAKLLKLEQVRSYLSNEFDRLETVINDYEGSGKLNPDWIEAARDRLSKARDLYLDDTIQDPTELGNIAKSLKDFEKVLGIEREDQESEKLEAQERQSLETEIREHHQKLHALIVDLENKPLDELEARIIEHFRANHNLEADSAVVKKQIAALHQLKDVESDLSTYAEEFEGDVQNLDILTDGELRRLHREIEELASKLDLLKEPEETISLIESDDFRAGEMAHATIEDLELCHTANDIREALLDNLGEEHVTFVNSKTFDEEYRQFSEEGFMVFNENPDGTWEIIIDESAMVDGNTRELIKQLTHELLHLEFERGQGVKNEVRRQMIEERPEEWEKIRAAFLEMADETNKAPPNGEEWEDDDILSELYAMQNEMGQFWKQGDDSATAKLNNILVGAGLGAALGDVPQKIKKFKEGAKVRGYQSGVERGEEYKDLSGVENPVEAVSQERAIYQNNKDQIEEQRIRIKDLQKSEYIGYTTDGRALLNAMDDYNETTESMNAGLLKNPDSAALVASIEERIGEVSSELNNVEAKVGKAAGNAPNNEISILRKMWVNTTFLSLSDIGQVAVDVYEFFQRRHKRKKADHAAQLGMALFRGTDLGREAFARQQKAEAEEVQEWQSRYEHLDAWQLEDELKNLAKSIDPSADQLKAILRILAQKGRINWMNEDLWICLNRMQSLVSLIPGDRVLLHNPVLLRQKLHKAMGEIWDYDEYSTLLRQNESAYESEKQKYNSEHDRSQDTLTDKLNDLLARHEAGEQVDPMEFESIITYCIENGKSFAENVFFHLMMGMAKGLLAPDRGLALGKHLNAWPSIDWFTSISPPYTQEDFDRLCKREFKDSYDKKNITDDGRDFKNWYWTVVQNTPRVIERVQKSVGERGWDHDWGRSIACLGSAQTAKQFLAGRSGQQETKHTAVGNAYVGAVQWLEENAKRPQTATKEHWAKIAAWIAMSEGILNGTAYHRKESDINTRQDEAMNTATPREAGVGNHGDSNLREHREITQGFLNLIDPNFFAGLRQEARTDEKKKELGQWAAAYLAENYEELRPDMAEVETIDQIFDKLDQIIGVMFQRMDDTYFREVMLPVLASGAA